jgi:hypothetical protein
MPSLPTNLTTATPQLLTFPNYRGLQVVLGPKVSFNWREPCTRIALQIMANALLTGSIQRPTRLLEIPKTGSRGDISLKSVEGVPVTARCACLSHRWGGPAAVSNDCCYSYLAQEWNPLAYAPAKFSESRSFRQ